ncbi:hypothetical protein T02_13402 [Trichinella nativa]|uniref:Uncharacterized protein n=1 Tax=Trichinella nativa TaxID=6335 RepID=A0A0V1KI10_9BILA|nr:hypothetical protein T02_13402 [Trichinella nativa]
MAYSSKDMEKELEVRCTSMNSTIELQRFSGEWSISIY